MLWVYGQHEVVDSYIAVIDFSRQILTSTYVRFWRLKSIPAQRLKMLKWHMLWFIFYTMPLAPILCTFYILEVVHRGSETQHQKHKLFDWRFECCSARFNPLTTKLHNLNFHPLEVVSRWRDPQLQVSENYWDLSKWRSTLFKSCLLMPHLGYL